MTSVIEFPAYRIRQAAEAHSERSGATAEVLIFPGVQVERLNLDLAERLAPVRGTGQQAAQAADLGFY